MLLNLGALLSLSDLFIHIVAGNVKIQAPFAVENSKKSKSVINDDLRSYIAELREKWNIPGLSLGIVRPDGEVEMQGFGKMNE